MTDSAWLAEQFNERRARLRAVAIRMLGSASEADDAVQDAWLKVSRADSSEVDNLGGWLTTVVARVCLDMLRSRKARREESGVPLSTEISGASTPEVELGLVDAIGPALFVVLDSLSPAERVSFVLHDIFDLSFDEIAPILDRSPDAARQLASRARRRVRGADTPESESDRRRDLVSAFLAASRDGDLGRLLAVLSPGVVLRADDLAVQTAAKNAARAPKLSPEVRGSVQVADVFKGRASATTLAFIDGEAGAVWATDGKVRVVFAFGIRHDAIQTIDVIMDPERIASRNVVML